MTRVAGFTVVAACGFACVALFTWGTHRAVWAALGAGVLASLAGVEHSLRGLAAARRRRRGASS
jgi:hypothetical protein